VFWNGKLCGLVSGGSDHETYVASLWPLCLLKYKYPDLGVLGGEISFGSLFDWGEIRSADWPMIKNRIEKRFDDQGKAYAFIRT
jgi:hypothetical protein